MRVGQNPNKEANARDFDRIVLAVVTHLPELAGYHEHRLEIVKACLNTMRYGAKVNHQFMVWDNGSCDEFREWLQKDFRPDFLMLSENIGKNTARFAMASILPKDTILCYSDDDMLFYEDWLQPQLDLLAHFPNVSCVTGYPVRTSFRWGNEHTLKWARRKAEVMQGRFLPQEWEDDFAVSIGRDIQLHRQSSLGDIDKKIIYKGKEAYATSHHCQMVSYAEHVIRAKNPAYGMAMGDERGFDIALDRIGLRLATTDRLCRHIGNQIDDKIRGELWLQV